MAMFLPPLRLSRIVGHKAEQHHSPQHNATHVASEPAHGSPCTGGAPRTHEMISGPSRGPCLSPATPIGAGRTRPRAIMRPWSRPGGTVTPVASASARPASRRMPSKRCGTSHCCRAGSRSPDAHLGTHLAAAAHEVGLTVDSQGAEANGGYRIALTYDTAPKRADGRYGEQPGG